MAAVSACLSVGNEGVSSACKEKGDPKSQNAARRFHHESEQVCVAHGNRGKTPSSAQCRRKGGPLDAQGPAKRVCPGGGSFKDAVDAIDLRDAPSDFPASCAQTAPSRPHSMVSGNPTQSPKAGSFSEQIPPPPPEQRLPVEFQLLVDVNEGSEAAALGVEEADADTLQHGFFVDPC